MIAGWPPSPPDRATTWAGVVAKLGAGVDAVAVGDKVIGISDRRSAHAEFVVVPADQLTVKPPQLPWEVAGSLYIAGTTACPAVRAVALSPNDTVAVAGAAGGVGSIAVQLARRTGATVLGIAGPSNDGWLSAYGVIPVNYWSSATPAARSCCGRGLSR